jgi:hypothetical protein
MKITLTTLLHSALALVGYVDDSILLTLPETQIAHQSNSPNRVKLPGKEGMSVENPFSVTNNYDIDFYKEVI